MMNMEEFKINLSSLNEGEVCKLLLDALNLTNSKCIDLSNEVAKLKEKLDRAELDKTKLSLEKDGEIAKLKETISDQENELKDKKIEVAQQKEIHQEEKSGLLETIAEKEQEIDRLKQCVETAEKATRAYKCSVLNNQIADCIMAVKTSISKLKNDDGQTIGKYLNSLIIEGESYVQSSDDINTMIEVLLKPNGFVSRAATLIWWLQNDTTRKRIEEQMYESLFLEVELKQVMRTLATLGYEVNIPTCGFLPDVPNYELYSNALSSIDQVFPDIEFEQAVLCEIYSVSYNDNLGKCYSL